MREVMTLPVTRDRQTWSFLLGPKSVKMLSSYDGWDVHIEVLNPRVSNRAPFSRLRRLAQLHLWSLDMDAIVANALIVSEYRKLRARPLTAAWIVAHAHAQLRPAPLPMALVVRMAAAAQPLPPAEAGLLGL